jgi:uncharacterized membrane protein YhaH (DUF805 family)
MIIQFAVSLTLMLLIIMIVPHLSQVVQGFIGLLVIAVSLPMLVAQFAVMSQRCRDLDKPGYFVILTFVPIISIFFQIYLTVMPGTDGENKYGSDPLASD